jgi:hypothetical protein
VENAQAKDFGFVFGGTTGAIIAVVANRVVGRRERSTGAYLEAQAESRHPGAVAQLVRARDS